ncbi:hypothetical protein BRD17_03630 [Halobacteriales archaeon SW_7_68_16]|nr:MAG: hypothetical protein BRD17_03630 [Halobacteriales archaeon SW_7_68_16]
MDEEVTRDRDPEEALSESDEVLDDVQDLLDDSPGTSPSPSTDGKPDSTSRDRQPDPTGPTDRTDTDGSSGFLAGVFGGDEGTDAETETTETGTDESLRSRLGGLFSPRSFLGVSIVLLLGATIGSILPTGVGTALGMVVGGFLIGLLGERRRYVETAVSGVAVGGLLSIADLRLLVIGGVPLLALGAGIGFAAALIGVYFGRDLRTGLTRDI